MTVRRDRQSVQLCIFYKEWQCQAQQQQTWKLYPNLRFGRVRLAESALLAAFATLYGSAMHGGRGQGAGAIDFFTKEANISPLSFSLYS